MISARIVNLVLTTTFLCQGRTNFDLCYRSAHPTFPKRFSENSKRKYPFLLDQLRFILKQNLLKEEAGQNLLKWVIPVLLDLSLKVVT